VLPAVLIKFTDNGVPGIVTVVVSVVFVFTRVATLVMVVPATEAVGVTNSCNVALAPLARDLTFHISVA